MSVFFFRCSLFKLHIIMLYEILCTDYNSNGYVFDLHIPVPQQPKPRGISTRKQAPKTPHKRRAQELLFSHFLHLSPSAPQGSRRPHHDHHLSFRHPVLPASLAFTRSHSLLFIGYLLRIGVVARLSPFHRTACLWVLSLLISLIKNTEI